MFRSESKKRDTQKEHAEYTQTRYTYVRIIYHRKQKAFHQMRIQKDEKRMLQLCAVAGTAAVNQ